MKVLKVAIALTLALGLVIGIALPGLADSNEAEVQALPKILRGKVISLDEENQDFFVIQAGEQEPITILVNSDTKHFKALIPRKAIALARHRIELRQPGELEGVRAMEPAMPMKLRAINQAHLLKRVKDCEKPALRRVRAQEQALEGVRQQLRDELVRLRHFGRKASFDDIAIGDRVVVRAVLEEGKPLAKVVVIIKPTTYNRVVGTITDISPIDKSITIAPASGSDNITLNYNKESRFILRGTTKLEEGQFARAVYDEEMIARAVFAPIGVPEPLD